MARVVLARCPNLTMAASENSVESVGARLLISGHEAREWLLAKLYLLSARDRARCDERRARPYQSALSSNWVAGRLACRSDRPNAAQRVALCTRSSYAEHCSVHVERARSCTQQGRSLTWTPARGVVSCRLDGVAACMAEPASCACSRAGRSCHRRTDACKRSANRPNHQRVPHPVIRKGIFITRSLSGERIIPGKRSLPYMVRSRRPVRTERPGRR